MNINVNLKNNEILFASDKDSNYVTSAKIRCIPDPDGVFSETNLPGKLQFLTTGDDGKERTKLEIDKNGRVLFYGPIWAVTSEPTGSPINIINNSDIDSQGSKLTLNRSRGNFYQPTSVKKDDVLFRLVYSGHDGFKYRDSASIEARVTDEVTYGKIPTEILIKTNDINGKLKLVAKFTNDQKLCIDKINVLSKDHISVESKIKLFFAEIVNSLKLPIYTDIEERDRNIVNPESGMIILFKNKNKLELQANIDGTANGWISF